MIPPAAACVHSLAQARLALAADPALRLISAPAAASHAGAAWWLALIQAAYGDLPHPRQPYPQDLLDCADAAGHAMQALRAGQRGLILSPATPAYAAVAAAAVALGATIVPARPPALDLSRPDGRHRLAMRRAAPGLKQDAKPFSR